MLSPENRPKHIKLFVIVLILGVVFSVFSALYIKKLNDTAALYIGLPIILALGVSLLETHNTIMQNTIKYLTLALLLSGPLLQEGFLCIIMAAPILYAVAAIFAALISYILRKVREGKAKNTLRANVLVLVLLFMSLEGTLPTLTYERENVIQVTKVVDAPVEAVRNQLAQKPTFEKPRSFFLRIFPKPVATHGEGLKEGSVRHLDFVYYKWVFFNAHKGRTTLKIMDVSDNQIKVNVISDTSYISNYLTWHDSKVTFKPTSENKTEVTWSIRYDRKLDPFWYFGPMQYYAVWLTAHNFIDNLATPVGDTSL